MWFAECSLMSHLPRNAIALDLSTLRPTPSLKCLWMFATLTASDDARLTSFGSPAPGSRS